MEQFEAWTLGYLANALWQAPVIFCAAWAMTRIARHAGPVTRHKVWVMALLAEAALPACPTCLVQGARAILAALLAKSASSGPGIQVTFGLETAYGGNLWRLSHTSLTILLIAYGLSVLYFAVRLVWGLWQTHGMRLRAHPAKLTNETGANLAIALSREIAGPVTVGLWRGTVLLPRGFLERVTAEDLRAVLAHEGAHVWRCDFLKNALYGLATLPIAFHPALWLTRRRVAESREMICDAMAAETVAGRERYAGSLLRLASMQVGTPDRMLHAIGIFGLFDANSFERRVMHLTANRMEMKGARRIATAVACGVLGLGTCATALAWRIGAPVQLSQSSPQLSNENSRIARVSGGVMAGNVLSKVNPVYPPDAKAEHISGSVVMSAVIGTDGMIENLQVVSGPEKLRTSALDAVRQWTYKPYILNGVPVSVQTTITVNYSFGN